MSEACSPQPPTYYSLLGAAAEKQGAVHTAPGGVAAEPGSLRAPRDGCGHDPRSCPQHNESLSPAAPGRRVPFSPCSPALRGGFSAGPRQGRRRRLPCSSWDAGAARRGVPPGRAAEGTRSRGLPARPALSSGPACPPLHAALGCSPGQSPAAVRAVHRPCPAASGTRRRGLGSGLLPPPRGLQARSAGRGGPAPAWEAAGSPGKVTSSEEQG